MWTAFQQPLLTRTRALCGQRMSPPQTTLPLPTGGRGATGEAKRSHGQDSEVHSRGGDAWLGACAGSQACASEVRSPCVARLLAQWELLAEAELGSWGCEPGGREPRLTGVRQGQPWPQKWRPSPGTLCGSQRGQSRENEVIRDRSGRGHHCLFSQMLSPAQSRTQCGAPVTQ